MTCDTRSLTLDLLAFDFLEGRERDRVARHVDDCATCRDSLSDRREDREIIALVLAMEPVAPPMPAPVAPPRTLSPILLFSAAAAAVLLLLLGPALLLPRYELPPERPVAEVPAWEPGRGPAEEPLLDPDLAVRVRELEARVQELLANRAAVVPPPVTDPGEAIAAYDWDGLAEALLVVNPELVQGRVPADARVLVRYVESLKELARVAEAAGLPGDLTSLARDPRTGPRLFGAVVRRAWPEAAPTDVAAAEEGARVAMTDYGAEVERATNPAAVSAAEERLAGALTEEVEKVEKRYGEPEVEVTPVVPQSTATRTDTVRKDAEVLVRAVGVGVTDDRVLRGTAADVEEEIAALLADDLSVSAALLGPTMSQWVADYRSVRSSAAADVVAAFEAGLAGQSGESDVSSSAVRRLRSALLDTQAKAEESLLRVLDDAAASRLRKSSRPTFFLVTAVAASAQRLGNSTR